jgi:uncharacterized protein (TIGR00288 family)
VEEKTMVRKFAVFVDGDNICAKDYELAIKEIAIHGEILIKQVWGDWTTPHMNTWKDVLVNEPAATCQQFRSGKNATDTRIIIEATKLMLLNTNINAFCIVSTDADFHVLAQDLRANGKYVIGIGKKMANPIWKEACNEFVTLENIKCEETGILLDEPKHYGLVKNERGIFHFSIADINGDIEKMTEGAQVKFNVLKEPDPDQPEKINQRGKAANVRLVA